MIYLREILLELPEFKYDSNEISAILEKNYLSAEAKDFIAARISNSGIISRSFVRPLQEIIELDGQQKRSEIFENCLPKLFKQLLEKSKIDLNPQAVISTSCSVPSLPAMDLALLKYMNLDSFPIRIPVYQQGCLGGVWALSLANKLDCRESLICSYELCSLLFQPKTETLTQMMGATLFADGIGAAVIDKEEKNSLLKIIASADFIIPESSKILGYNILDNATELVLSPQIPLLLSRYLPDFLKAFLSAHNLELTEIKHFLAHPGGLKIIDNIKDCLNLEKHSIGSSYAILEKHGNMSSASIFFVIDHFLKQADYSSGEFVIILGVGPGINLELLLCQIP